MKISSVLPSPYFPLLYFSRWILLKYFCACISYYIRGVCISTDHSFVKDQARISSHYSYFRTCQNTNNSWPTNLTTKVEFLVNKTVRFVLLPGFPKQYFVSASPMFANFKITQTNFAKQELIKHIASLPSFTIHFWTFTRHTSRPRYHEIIVDISCDVFRCIELQGKCLYCQIIYSSAKCLILLKRYSLNCTEVISTAAFFHIEYIESMESIEEKFQNQNRIRTVYKS